MHDFKQLCSCLHIQGMTRDTLKWKLFLFSLMGVAKHWYARYVESAHREWEILQSKFCLVFFPISRVVHPWVEILTFKQKEEPLGVAWACFTDLASSRPNLAITEPTLLQHFYLSLSKDSAWFLDLASRRAFLRCTIGEGKKILAKILENTPHTNVYDEPPEEEKESIPTQGEISIAKSPPISSKDSAIDPEPQIPQISKQKKFIV